MKRTRRLSIEIEHREIEYQEITVYPANASATPGQQTAGPFANPATSLGPRLGLAHAAAFLGLTADGLRSSLEQGSIHFHPAANSRLLLCRGQECGPATEPEPRPKHAPDKS